MASNREDTFVLEDLAGPPVDVAYDVSGRRMASCTASSSGSIIQVYELGPGPESWTQIAAWENERQVTHLTWAHPEYGRLLAGGTTAGTVLVWAQAPELQPSGSGTDGGEDAAAGGSGAAGGNGGGGGGYYDALAELVCGLAPCRAVAFAPRQTGLVVAALLDDGSVALHEAEEPLAPRAWNLHSKIKAGPRGACAALCWRPFSPGVPPMLCVGAGPRALVWQYVLALNSWQVVARVEAANGQDVAAAHWAPPLGRPAELLALGAGRDLLICSLSGDTAALQVEHLATLEHEEAVWKVEWDLWGNQVAAATEGQQVHVYRPDLVGSWVKAVWVQGKVPKE